MYQILWKDEKGSNMCMIVQTEQDKAMYMEALASFNPVCLDKRTSEQKQVQKITKHKPIQRGARYLTSQASFGLKPQGEVLYVYMIPDLGLELAEYFKIDWVSEKDGKSVELVGLVWKTLPEIKKLCNDLRIKKLTWLIPAHKKASFDYDEDGEPRLAYDEEMPYID